MDQHHNLVVRDGTDGSVVNDELGLSEFKDTIREVSLASWRTRLHAQPGTGDSARLIVDAFRKSVLAATPAPAIYDYASSQMSQSLL